MISKILFYHPLIFYPITALAALQIIAIALFIKKRNKSAIFLSGSTLFITTLLSLPFTSITLLNSLQERHEVFEPSKNSETANAVIALGGGIRPLADFELNRELGEAGDRLALAIALVKANHAKYLVISGGLPTSGASDGTTNEAYLAKTIAIRSGLKEEQIIINKTGYNTGAEARFIAKLSAKRQWRSMIISTSAYHMSRSLKKISSLSDSSLIAAPSDFRTVRTAALFKNKKKLNLLVPTLSALNESTRSIKEYLGIFRESLKKRASKLTFYLN